MAGIYHPTRGGNRGGKDQFKWDDIKDDKDRENYLGHSLMAPVGRWQKGKDLIWYSKGRDEDAAVKRKEELNAIKDVEAQAMANALGHGAPPIKADHGDISKENLKEAFKRSGASQDADRVHGMGYKSSALSSRRNHEYGVDFKRPDEIESQEKNDGNMKKKKKKKKSEEKERGYTKHKKEKKKKKKKQGKKTKLEREKKHKRKTPSSSSDRSESELSMDDSDSEDPPGDVWKHHLREKEKHSKTGGKHIRDERKGRSGRLNSNESRSRNRCKRQSRSPHLERSIEPHYSVGKTTKTREHKKHDHRYHSRERRSWDCRSPADHRSSRKRNISESNDSSDSSATDEPVVKTKRRRHDSD